MTTAYLYDDEFLLHDDFEHPENATRLRAIMTALEQSNLLAELTCLTPRAATIEEVLAVHHRRMVEHTRRMVMFGGGYLNPDTYIVPESWDAALLAAGSVTRAVEAVIGGEVSNAFALVRPPGHHATPTTAMGFCLINNVAVAARVACTQLGLKRVAIIDWDTHHGNGTQDIFYDDPRVLYVSSHTYPFYPGTGHWREIGSGDGEGATLNLPLPPHTGDQEVEYAYDEIVTRAVRRFDPELIIISAGYDCHWRDPLAPMNMTITGYTRLARMLFTLAEEICGGRIVCALEGGYDLDALAQGVVSTFRVLQGRPDLVVDALGAAPPSRVNIEPMIANLRRVHPLLNA